MKKIFLLSTLYFLLTTLLTGCATAPVYPAKFKETVIIDEVPYISAQSLCEVYNLNYHLDPIVRKVTLSKDGKEVRIMADSSGALLNDTLHTMNKEAKFYQGSVLIPRSFAYRTLAPFFRERPIKRKLVPAKVPGWPIKNVIIDPGHGGKDPGAVGKGGLMEKDVVLDIARRLKRKLNAAGINVTLTRESDRFISLAQRARIANAKGVDFFISVHANASRSRWVNGVEVFYLSESIDDSWRSFQAAKNYDLNFEDPFCGKDTPAILWDLILSEHRNSSVNLAEQVLHSLSRDLSQRNRGTKPARFYVLKGTNIPAILVEVGFISNVREEKRLKDAFYRDKIASAIIKGLIQYNRNVTQRRTVRQ